SFRSVSEAPLLALTWLRTSALRRALVAEFAAVVVELFHQCVQLPLLVLVKDIEHRRLLCHLHGIGTVVECSALHGQSDVLRIPLLLPSDQPFAFEAGEHP